MGAFPFGGGYFGSYNLFLDTGDPAVTPPIIEITGTYEPNIVIAGAFEPTLTVTGAHEPNIILNGVWED